MSYSSHLKLIIFASNIYNFSSKLNISHALLFLIYICIIQNFFLYLFISARFVEIIIDIVRDILDTSFCKMRFSDLFEQLSQPLSIINKIFLQKYIYLENQEL